MTTIFSSIKVGDLIRILFETFLFNSPMPVDGDHDPLGAVIDHIIVNDTCLILEVDSELLNLKNPPAQALNVKVLHNGISVGWITLFEGSPNKIMYEIIK